MHVLDGWVLSRLPNEDGIIEYMDIWGRKFPLRPNDSDTKLVGETGQEYPRHQTSKRFYFWKGGLDSGIEYFQSGPFWTVSLDFFRRRLEIQYNGETGKIQSRVWKLVYSG